jgi:hypothetical protein
LFGVALLLNSVFAEDKPSPSAPAPEPKWDVRVEVLMVALPQEKALALLPDLRNPAKIDRAVAQIMPAIGRKEATLMGLPMVVTHSGQRAVTEAVLEKRYPTEFEPPQVPQTVVIGPPAPAEKPKMDVAIPTAFETRNMGATLEVEPVVSPNGEWINLNLVPQRVDLLGFDSYDAVSIAVGTAKIDQPKFTTAKVTTSLSLRSGQHCLIAIHKLAQPEGHLEFFILQATAIPVK